MNHQTSEYKSWAERNSFADWALALIWIVVAFIAFQLLASIIALVLIGLRNGMSSNPAAMLRLMNDNLGLVFIGNSAGQILFLGLGTWFFTRLHASKWGRPSFLRLKAHRDTLKNMALAFIVVIAFQPIVWFLGWLNSLLPIPDVLQNLQTTQAETIQNYIQGDNPLILMLFHVAMVPAVCEEILYRGYVLRAFQKGWNIMIAIVLSGILFGLYHLQLGNLIPLATLGMLFAYLTWVSRSIFPAMIAHFVNNGGSVLLAKYYPNSTIAKSSTAQAPSVSLVIISLLITGFILYYMYQQFKGKPKVEI